MCSYCEPHRGASLGQLTAAGLTMGLCASAPSGAAGGRAGFGGPHGTLEFVDGDDSTVVPMEVSLLPPPVPGLQPVHHRGAFGAAPPQFSVVQGPPAPNAAAYARGWPFAAAPLALPELGRRAGVTDVKAFGAGCLTLVLARLGNTLQQGGAGGGVKVSFIDPAKKEIIARFKAGQPVVFSSTVVLTIAEVPKIAPPGTDALAALWVLVSFQYDELD
jgi:hypothetical protein